MPNRTLCEVLEEIRKCNKTRNYSYLLGLVEEVQSMANRMEAALWDQKEYTRLMKEKKELKREIEELEAKKRESEGT